MDQCYLDLVSEVCQDSGRPRVDDGIGRGDQGHFLQVEGLHNKVGDQFERTRPERKEGLHSPPACRVCTFPREFH